MPGGPLMTEAHPFVWRDVQHDVHIAYLDSIGDERRYTGWFDQTVGCGVMGEVDRWTFDELVEHWKSEMRKRN
jgi:hypothetical protein